MAYSQYCVDFFLLLFETYKHTEGEKYLEEISPEIIMSLNTFNRVDEFCLNSHFMYYVSA